MTSMQWQLGMLGTISAFAYRHRETKKNLCRGGRSQDLPSTDSQPDVRHLKYKKNQQCTHTNTHTVQDNINTTTHRYDVKLPDIFDSQGQVFVFRNFLFLTVGKVMGQGNCCIYYKRCFIQSVHEHCIRSVEIHRFIGCDRHVPN